MSSGMKEYQFHPFAEEYPLMPARELGRMEEAMIERGYDPRFPIVLYQGKILDGRNRYQSAQKANVKPIFVKFDGTDDEARVFVQTANEERRHLATEWLERRRAERIERVAAARREGDSLRAIAEAEGVSEMTIRNDLNTATAKGFAVEPPDGKVTGKDRKKRAATPAKNTKKKGVTATATPVAVEPPASSLAEAANAVLAEEEDEQTIEDQIKAKNRELESWCRDLMKFADTMPTDPWLDDLNRREGALQKLRNCCESIRSAKCCAPCPKCAAVGCRKCHNTGRVTKYALDQMG